MLLWLKRALLAFVLLLSLVLTAAGVSYVASEAPLVPATVLDDASLPALEIDGVKLHLKTFGDPQNETLILLHGGPGNDFRHLLPLSVLSKDYHLVFYDQRGAGLSERVNEDKLDLEQLIEELHLIGLHFSPAKKLRLLGHSWGAMLSAAYLERHPERVSHLVLIEPGFLNQETFDSFMERTNHGLPGFSFALLGRLWVLGLRALKIDGPDEDAALDEFILSLAMTDVPHHPMAGYYCDGKARPGTFDGWRMGARSSFAIQSKGIDRESLKLKLHFVDNESASFPHEVLFLAGTCNTIIGEDVQRLHMKLYPKSEIALIEHAGHLMIQERTLQVLDAIEPYLTQAHE